MSSRRTFVDLCLNGDVLMDEIDDFVEAWHEDPEAPEPITQTS